MNWCQDRTGRWPMRGALQLRRGQGVLVPSDAAWGGGALGSAGGRLRPQSSPALPPAAQAWSATHYCQGSSPFLSFPWWQQKNQALTEHLPPSSWEPCETSAGYGGWAPSPTKVPQSFFPTSRKQGLGKDGSSSQVKWRQDQFPADNLLLRTSDRSP